MKTNTIEFSAVIVRKDNLMYLFYDEHYVFGVDTYEPSLIRLMLSKRLRHGKIYSKDELEREENVHERKMLFALTTHHHFDYSGGNDMLQEMFPSIKIYIGKNVDDYTLIEFNGSLIKCIGTPCHTLDSMCYFVDNKYVLTGDYLFKIGCGRFFEGNAEMFIASFKKLTQSVMDTALMLYGHEYTEGNLMFALTKRSYTECEIAKIRQTNFMSLREEKQLNIFLAARNSTDLQKLRTEKDNFI